MNLKEKARAYFGAVNRCDEMVIKAMVREDYIHHNPFLATGRGPFIELVRKMKPSGFRILNQRMIQDGRHVIMHHKLVNAGEFGANEAAAFHVT